MGRYLKNAARKITTPPQSEPLDERQVENNAGGYVYEVDKWTRLDRFLILGSEGGTYYATEQKITKDNLKCVMECVKEDGLRVVKRIVEISDQGRAAKNDPALMALAYCAGSGEKDVNKTIHDPVRAAALSALPKVARIGTHLFHFIDYVTEFRGWGRGLKTAVTDWYTLKPTEKLADQVTKYQQRDGWSHKDILRLAHVKFPASVDNSIARWVVGKTTNALEIKRNEVISSYLAVPDYPWKLEGHIRLQKAENAKQAANLIREYGLVRESVPTELLNEKEVWEALLDKMPMTAMIRNLGNLSKCGLLIAMSDAEKKVVEALSNQEQLKGQRVHPIQVLIATKTYESGHGVKGKGIWNAAPKVVDALNDAYYLTFGNLEPTGKRYYLGLDISGSMWMGQVAGVEGLFPSIAAGAMAMVTVKTEQNYYAAGFTAGLSGYGGRWGGDGSEMTPLTLSPKQRLDDVVKAMHKLSERMGGTDCALPMIDALKKNLKVDMFIILTDNETWAGDVHPVQALREYRQKTGIGAKLAVVGMTATEFSIADSSDGGMMDFVGFDANVPQLLADFAKG